jgi:hypothetical protein
MRTQSSNTFPTGAQSAPRAPAAADERGPVVMTEAELTRVAAGGSKPGVASASGVKFRT